MVETALTCSPSRFNKATAPSLIKHYRDCVKGAPRELYANVLLTAGPAGKESLMVIQICYVGPRDKGQEYLQAISSWDGEKCLLNEVDEKSFLHHQDSVAQVLRGKGLPTLQPIFRSPIYAFFILCSGETVVHPFSPHLISTGRHYQRHRHAIRRHSSGMQYVCMLSPILMCP